MSETASSDLLRIKARYEHACELAREGRCSCNSARRPVEVEYLLEDDPPSDDLAKISPELRSQHCPVHSPPVSERHWLLEAARKGYRGIDRGGVVRFRVFDIETVPDSSVWTPGPSSWRWEVGGEFRGGNSVRARFATDEMVLVRDDPFPPPQAHRVVAISWVDIVLDAEHSPRYRLDSLYTDCGWSFPRGESSDLLCESHLLRKFGDAASEAAEKLCLVTWNGRGFDLPVINLRSLRHGIACPWYYKDRDVRYRYSTEGHLDLMDFLGDYGAARNMKLGDVARLVGLPGKTGEVTGASVHDVYRETRARAGDTEFCYRRMSEIARYCLRDSIQTALIFLRSRYHLGKVDRDEYHLCLDTFAQSQAVRDAIEVDWDAVRLPSNVELGSGVDPCLSSLHTPQG